MSRRKTKKIVTKGMAVVNATFNNTHVTITDRDGGVLTRSSAGENGFKGARKPTPYAAQLTAQKAAEAAAKLYGMKEVEVKVKGPGVGRDSAVKAVAAVLKITRIEDVTPLPHNGCRPPKKRRV